ncbi:hypothetical protein ACGFY9_27310 [Streptomyces sp. NPDC048504]|uniref:hypothetical protein n=1 Tax=Streptomyces sp. NPDC048504 TaxID=3365559 RepID=UPI0037198EA1
MHGDHGRFVTADDGRRWLRPTTAWRYGEDTHRKSPTSPQPVLLDLTGTPRPTNGLPDQVTTAGG